MAGKKTKVNAVQAAEQQSQEAEEKKHDNQLMGLFANLAEWLKKGNTPLFKADREFSASNIFSGFLAVLGLVGALFTGNAGFLTVTAMGLTGKFVAGKFAEEEKKRQQEQASKGADEGHSKAAEDPTDQPATPQPASQPEPRVTELTDDDEDEDAEVSEHVDVDAEQTHAISELYGQAKGLASSLKSLQEQAQPWVNTATAMGVAGTLLTQFYNAATSAENLSNGLEKVAEVAKNATSGCGPQ